MQKSDSQTEKPKDQRRYSQKQFEILNHCSAKKDMSGWNQWRSENVEKEVLLEGASFWHAYLKGANLKGAKLQRADLRGTNLEGAKLQNAVLWEAELQGANLRETDLQNAKLMRSHLQGTELGGAKLQGADFSRAIVDGETLIWRCEADRKTMFEGVALGATRIYPETKQLLEYNIRRKNWEERYKKGTLWRQMSKRLFVQPFWLMGNYGLSTGRIIATFFGLAFVFALVYWLVPSCVVVNSEVGDIRGLWHSFYFSVVTMTTLGFGDIAANPDSWTGQTLLMVQVILGYVLLGALVTRFAVSFTAGGPAGKFAERTRDMPCPKPKTGWDELARDETILQTGDVIHVQNRGILSKLVRFFSRAWKEEPSWASHSAMVLRVGEEIEIIEALWKTVIRPITSYKGSKSKLLVCRKPGGIDEEQKKKMIEKAEYYKGQTYGYLKIVLHVLDRLLNNRYVFRRLIKDNEYPICSWLVAYVYDRVLKYHFGAPPNAAQPDDILDHCVDYEWEFIWADSGKSVTDFCRTYKLSDKIDVA